MPSPSHKGCAEGESKHSPRSSADHVLAPTLGAMPSVRRVIAPSSASSCWPDRLARRRARRRLPHTIPYPLRVGAISPDHLPLLVPSCRRAQT